MDPVWALRQIAFQLERSGAPTYRVRAFRRAAETGRDKDDEAAAAVAALGEFGAAAFLPHGRHRAR